VTLVVTFPFTTVVCSLNK